MGPPDRCEHAASIITDLLQSIRAREEGGQGVGNQGAEAGVCCVTFFMLKIKYRKVAAK